MFGATRESTHLPLGQGSPASLLSNPREFLSFFPAASKGKIGSAPVARDATASFVAEMKEDAWRRDLGLLTHWNMKALSDGI